MSGYDSEPPPPTKASLLKWWKVFSSKQSNKDQQSRGGPGGAGQGAGALQRGQVAPAPYQPPGRGLRGAQDGNGRVFGVSLEQSLKYASVAISMVAPDGRPTVYGYVPIVVAKCGMMLKESGSYKSSVSLLSPHNNANAFSPIRAATSTEGIFRVSGSNKRINELQAVFDAPPRYGKDLDWSTYSVHDAASVLRRYLNMMPEPVIPQDLYRAFTGVLQKHLPLAESIAAYRHLISLLPPTSRYLLLYLLDFLSVFARFSSKNLMTASNLAVVFQPGLVSTRREGADDALLGFPGFPGGQVPVAMGMTTSAGGGAAAREGAGEHGRGKEVLEFLIEQQSHFVFGLEPPVKEKKEGERGQEYGSPAGDDAKREDVKGKGTLGVPGATDLGRRGSERSVERRRLRKSHDGGNGKVKRSKTLPAAESRLSRSEGHRGQQSVEQSPVPSSSRSPSQTPERSHPATFLSATPPSSAPRTPPLPTGIFRSKKSRRDSRDTSPTPSFQPPPSDVTMSSSGSRSPEQPKWLPKRSGTLVDHHHDPNTDQLASSPVERSGWGPFKSRPKSPPQ
ncbi:GTPase-activating protein SAC7, partial [Phenoliferia sp. Uapishka_3]